MVAFLRPIFFLFIHELETSTVRILTITMDMDTDNTQTDELPILEDHEQQDEEQEELEAPAPASEDEAQEDEEDVDAKQRDQLIGELKEYLRSTSTPLLLPHESMKLRKYVFNELEEAEMTVEDLNSFREYTEKTRERINTAIDDGSGDVTKYGGIGKRKVELVSRAHMKFQRERNRDHRHATYVDTSPIINRNTHAILGWTKEQMQSINQLMNDD